MVTKKVSKNIARIARQKLLLQRQRTALAKQLAKAGVRSEIGSLKAQRFALARQTRVLRLAKLRRFGRGAIIAQKRAGSFLRAIKRFK